MKAIPRVIAHRGYRELYPENTLPALEAAIRGGADGVELDVQFCRDGTPIVVHDPDLKRVSGEAASVADLEPAELGRYSAHEPERLGQRFRGTPIPTLREVAERLAGQGEALVFVEVKVETLPAHDLPRRVKNVLEACAPLGERAVIISFDDRILREARSLRQKVPVGWVLPQWDLDMMDRADVLEPDYIFVDKDVLPPPPNPLWDGRWQWVVYEVNDPEPAQELARRGIHFIETAAVETMVMAHRAE